MSEPFFAYLPIDRYQALGSGRRLPERTQGAALFADISGFTRLTEALGDDLGPRRGAEELSNHLNRVYEAIVDRLHRYQGSVIGFAGDSITCWLDQDDGSRGVAAALAMQEAMVQFAAVETPSGEKYPLTIKVAVVTGPVRRFIVGDPEYLLLDVMAGATLMNLAAAEDQASPGEVVLDQRTAEALGDRLKVDAWREDAATGKRYALVSGLGAQVPEKPWPEMPKDVLGIEESRAWLLPRIHERLKRGLGEFVAELKPAVGFFLRFSGIDYDEDEEASAKLDTLVREVERILGKYDGNITHLTIGDKGSFFCIVFGAPINHEDNAIRACAAGLEINQILSTFDFIESLQTGIAQGRMWTGAYGSTTRRTYDILGDEANLAARLMIKAEPGTILATTRVMKATSDTFTWEGQREIAVKGKIDAVPVVNLVGYRRRRSAGIHAPRYTLPMIGRERELESIFEKFKLVMSGSGQIIGITSEAGIGKTRLAAEVVRRAEMMGFTIYGGECQSYGTNTSYLVWQAIWQNFFNLDGSMSLSKQMGQLERELIQIKRSFLARLPLLGAALNLPIPDNDLTASLTAKVRKSSLESMLVECLQARSKREPLLLVLEDCQWLDPLSHDLLESIGRSITDSAVMILVIYRPSRLQRLQSPRVSTLLHFTEIELEEFNPEEADQLIRMKLVQVFGEEIPLSTALLKRITTQAAGNPFYIEELLNYLKGLGIDLSDREALEGLDLPGSITSLVLSRIDQLTEGQQITLKVASVIGRLFSAAMIWGAYPKVGEVEVIREHLDLFSQLELTILDTPDPEMVYLFKHVFTQEVAYDGLPYATKAMLHEAIGDYIEREFVDSLDQFTNLLAHHYENSQNYEKKRKYLLKAGEAAQRDYANEAAIDYYRKVMSLLPAEDQIDVRLKLGKVLELIGEWQEAEEAFQTTLKQAEEIEDLCGQGWAETAMAELFRKQGIFDQALDSLERAGRLFEEIDDLPGIGQVLHTQGTIADQQGEYEEASRLMAESLAVREKIGDRQQSAYLLGNMGIVARRQGDLDKARILYEQSLTLRREINDRWGVANVLNNLGNLLLDLEDIHTARTSLEEAVAIHQELGDRWAIGNALNNLANVLRMAGDHHNAKGLYNQSLTIYRDLGDKWALAYLLEDVAWLAALRENGERALILSAAGEVLREEINAPLTTREAEKLANAIEPAIKNIKPKEVEKAKQRGQIMKLEDAIQEALR